MPIRNLGNAAGGAALTVDHGGFAASVAAGSVVARLADPFGGGSAFQAVGTVPAQLALSGSQLVRGSAAATVGTGYAVKVRATSADGAREVAETFTLVATGAAATGVLLPRTQAGFARVAAGGGRAIVAMAGDSVTAGWGAASAAGNGSSAQPTALPIRAKSWPQRLAVRLAAAGRRVRADAVWGTNLLSGNSLADYTTMNPDMSVGADWTYSNVQSFGGFGFRCQSGTQATVFAPQVAADRFDLYFTVGTFQVSDASGVLADVAVTAGGFNRRTVTRAAASTAPISIVRTGGSDMYLIGIVPYDSANPMLEIWNLGWPGSTTASWNAAAQNWHTLKAIGLVAPVPDLWMLELGANDAGAGVAAGTYQTQLQTIAQKMKDTGGDVQLVKCHPGLYGDARAMPAAYATAIDAVANTLGLPPAIDYGAAGLGNADYNDGIHLAASGYDREAQLAFDMVTARV